MKFLWWIPAVSIGALIYWFSDQSQPPGADLGPDYLLHSIGYGLFTVAVVLGITEGFQVDLTTGRILVALLIVLGYGCLDEFHQSFVPGRTASLKDILADSVGALVFLLLTLFVLHRAERRT